MTMSVDSNMTGDCGWKYNRKQGLWKDLVVRGRYTGNAMIKCIGSETKPRICAIVLTLGGIKKLGCISVIVKH